MLNFPVCCTGYRLVIIIIEVLIKAVAQANLNYTMCCFKFPEAFCDDVNAMLAKF